MSAKRVCPHCGQDLPRGDRLPGADPEPKKPEQVPLPAVLDDPEFRGEFLTYCRHRAQGWPRERWTVVAAERKLAALAKLGRAEAMGWVRFALEHGLKNIQEVFERGRNGEARPSRSNEQLLREAGLL